MNSQTAEQALDGYYVRARESLWMHPTVTIALAKAAAIEALGISATVDEIESVAARVCDFMRGAGRLCESPTYAELVQQGVIRHREARDVETESYERALASLRKYGP